MKEGDSFNAVVNLMCFLLAGSNTALQGNQTVVINKRILFLDCLIQNCCIQYIFIYLNCIHLCLIDIYVHLFLLILTVVMQ